MKNKKSTLECHLLQTLLGALRVKKRDLPLIAETLQNLKSSMQARQTAEDELQEQLDNMSTPEMKAKYKECREAETQLANLEKQLGI